MLETGAPVVPIALTGTDRARRGWRIRPVKVRVRFGPALRYPSVASASPRLAARVTERIWPCVELQWRWLRGLDRPSRPVQWLEQLRPAA